MKTIAVINQKGGVGKTACAYNLAFELSQLKQTILIDLDPSANATKGLNCYNKSEISSYDFLMKDLNYASCLVQPLGDYENLFVIPSHIKLALAQRDMQSKPFRETILIKKLSLIHNADRLVIIDCSPTLSELTINAIYAADFLLIPLTYEDDALEGIVDLFKVVNEIRPDGVRFKMLRNQYDARKTKTNAYIDEKLSDFIVKDALLKTIIRQDEAINQAKIERKPVFLYAPSSNGASDFIKLAGELQCLN